MGLKNFLLTKISQPHPETVNVVSKSVPIVFFGNIEKAEIGTLSLNPSNIEFDGSKRVIDRYDFGVDDNICLTEFQADEVYNSFMNYFNIKPYKKWFDTLNNIFAPCGFEYYNDRMVHLDISPWATSNKFGDLENEEKRSIIDIKIIKEILRYGSLKKLFINGKTASEEFQRDKEIPLKTKEFNIGGKKATLYIGKYKDCEILGWSPYLQNSYLTTSQKDNLIKEIRKYV